jgi:hypothetical protein
MGVVLKNKDKFNGTCYCKNEVCAYAGAGLGQDIFMSFALKHTGSGRRIKSTELPIRDNFLAAQSDLDKWAGKKKLQVCIVNKILSKEVASDEEREKTNETAKGISK